jgi:MoaA/NifB/PqqE/SkfB family radical SAM enzyme
MNFGMVFRLARVLRQMRGLEPTFASINVTNRCNESCPMCRVWGLPDQELSLPALERILVDLKQFGIRVIEVSGGEPFLRPDIFAIFTLLERLGFLCTVTTNGTLLTTETIGRLGEVRGLLQLAVSLDTLQHERYRLLRGSDLLDRVLANIDLLAGARLPFTLKLNMTLNPLNSDELFAILDFARERGMYLSVFPVNLGAGFHHRSDDPLLRCSEDERERMAGLFDQLKELRRSGQPLWELSAFYGVAATYLRSGRIGPCDAGRLFLDVRADGRVGVCVDQPPLGDLNREGIAEVWQRFPAAAGEIRACAEQTPCCYTCTYNLSITARNLASFFVETARVRWGMHRIRQRRTGRGGPGRPHQPPPPSSVSGGHRDDTAG